MSVKALTIVIPTPDDMHWHPRTGPTCRLLTPLTASQFGRALAIGNIPHHPIRTPGDIHDYRAEILEAARPVPHSFEPIMGIMLCDDTTPEEIDAACDAGAVFAKNMPVGVSFNLGFGVSDNRRLAPVYKRMAQRGMRLCVHGETPGIDVDDAEEDFFRRFAPNLVEIDGLKVIFEHLTTAFACDFVTRMWKETKRVYATITAHHPILTKKDWVSDKLYPHHFCKPTAKTENDRAALIRAMISGLPCFFFGSDTAAHPHSKKGWGTPTDGCSPGIFTAPVALQILAEIFTSRQGVDFMGDYTSRFGAEAYGLPRNRGSVIIRWADELQFVPLTYWVDDPMACNQLDCTISRMPMFEQTHWCVERNANDP